MFLSDSLKYNSDSLLKELVIKYNMMVTSVVPIDQGMVNKVSVDTDTKKEMSLIHQHLKSSLVATTLLNKMQTLKLDWQE